MESSPAVGSFQKAATLAIACLAVLLLTVDLTVLHLAVPALVTDLGPSGTQILWIADIYGFVVAGLLITMGSIGDRIGRKRLLLLGTGAFAVASVLSAYAPSAELLIVARTLLGVAGAAIMPSTLSIIRNVFTDPKQRTAAIGVWSGVSASGFVVGPIVGGLLLDSFWWGSVFLINLPILLAIGVAGFLILPESRDPSPGRLDPLSVVLSVGGLIAVVYAIKEAAKDGVAQVGVGVTALVGVVALTVFVKRQTRLSHPLIDVRLFRRIAFSGAISTNMFAMFAMVAQSLIFAQYFQSVLGWSPLKAGLAGLPGAAGATLGGVLAAPLITAIGRARVVFLGMGLAAVGISCYTMAGLTLNYPVFVLAMVPAGLGFGMAFTVTGDTVLATVPKERAGSGAAISETSMEVGGALGIAVLGSVLNAAYARGLDLPPGVPADAVPAVEESISTAVLTSASLPPDVADQVLESARQSFIDAFHATALVAAGVIACVAVFALVALRNVPKVIAETSDGDPADPTGSDGSGGPAAKDGAGVAGVAGVANGSGGAATEAEPDAADGSDGSPAMTAPGK
ncbi:MFS transporter [Streptomyces sp. 2-1]|uniref:MFS transporter n=1 Tax=Streptomyces sp. 2-1 TaxID=412710 RepID=UPI003AFAD8A0